MAATSTFPRSSIDYFSLPRKDSENPVSPSSLLWEESSYSDPALVESESCESLAHSPVSPTSLPYTSGEYALPNTGEPTLSGKADQQYPFGFEDLMSWGDPTETALSPLVEPLTTTLKLEPASPNMASPDMASPYNSVNSAAISGSTDDGSVAFQDSGVEGPLFQTPRDVTPHVTDISREGLYSALPPWPRPQPGHRVDSLSTTNSYASSSPTREARPRSVAIPQQPHSASPASTPHSSPEPTENRRKRKSSAESSESDCPPNRTGRHPPVKKTAHNMIEKRYRTNLNDKIAALRDSVPSLRATVSKNSRGEAPTEDLQGLAPAHKLNKATVLSKATEYIAHLEKRTKHLQKENQTLKARVEAFEILVMARSGIAHHANTNNGNSSMNMNQLNNNSNDPMNTLGRGTQGQMRGKMQPNESRQWRRGSNNNGNTSNRNSNANPQCYSIESGM